MKKIFLTIFSLLLVNFANAYESANGTYLVNVKVSNSNKFMKLGDGCYTFRGSSYSYSDGNGIKTQSSQGGIVFYIDETKTLQVDILHTETKNAHEVSCNLYTLTEAEYKVLYNAPNDGKTSYTFKTENPRTESFKIAIAAENKTFSGTTDLSSGYYALIATGEKGNTYLHSVTFSSAGPSDDATLSELLVDGKKISGFNKDYMTYSQTGCWSSTYPTVSATATDNKAKVEITQASESTTSVKTATVKVTAEDGKTIKTYTVSFQNDTNTPVVSSFTLEGYAGTISGDNVSITVSANFDLTKAYEPIVEGQHIYNTDGAQIFSEGTNTYTISSCGPTKTLTITIIRNTTPASTEAALSSLTVSAGTLNPAFSETVYDYVDSLEYNTTTVPTVSATKKDANAKVEITQATSVTGKATIVVTAEDGKTTKTYTVQMALKPAPPAPPAPDPVDGVHSPGVYIWDKMDGGYGAKFVNYGGKDYEVFYVNKDEENGKLGISTSNVDKGGYLVASGTDDKNFKSKDGWIVGKTNGRGGETGFSAQEEFQQSVHSFKLHDGLDMTMKVQGYSEFALVGQDNSDAGTKNLLVYIDGELQKQTLSKSYTIRRFKMTTGVHTIKVTASNTSDSKVVAFSLQVGTSPVLPAPKIELLSGKTTGQVIYQTQQIERIRYTVKYNRSTSLHWVGTEATGIGLTTFKGEKYDTVMISGNANCPTGIYNYFIVANDGTKGVDSLEGSFEVKSKIWATTDTVVNTWAGQNIKQIKFRYYALSADDITLSWTGGNAPSGITGSIIDGVYVIGGKSNDIGTFTFTISVKGGNSVHGSITLKSFNPGVNPIMYLYKGDYKDGTYTYLKSIGKNLIEMEQNETLRDLNDYQLYTMIIISETCDADNKEVLAIARGEAKKPVLNMKSFSYSPGRLDWGVPDNGSIKNRSITVYREDHPIFRKMGKKRGDEITMLDTIITRGLMPAEVTYEGTACLATAWTRGREYNTDGKQETFLHEVPADMNGGQKYLCLPIASSSSERLSTGGKLLINNCIDYLLSTESGVTLPELRITNVRVKVDSTYYTGDIDETTGDIIITVPEGSIVNALKPLITLSSDRAFVTPGSGETVDLSDTYFGVDFTVSDYVNKRIYNMRITFITGLEEIYEDGEWVNIYDIRGQKITTTNDIQGLSLERGIYIVVGSKGSRKISVP